jgi:hypothetical protein
VAAALACVYPFYTYALDHYGSKGDKWQHCWVSCKVGTWCGGPVVAILAGAGKEVLDAAGDQLGYHSVADWQDFVADLEGVACVLSTDSCYSCCSQALG